MISSSKTLGKLDSSVLAEYTAYKRGPLSHLKLQKLVYYVQAYHLAYFDAPIIDDDFEAWVHGPVSRKLFNEMRDMSLLYKELSYVQGEGEPTPDKKMLNLTAEQLELIDDVLDEYGPLTGLQLENLSHSEQPWIQARKGYRPADKCTRIIKKGTMRQFYKDQIYGQEN